MLEIYNGTGQAVNLANYQVWRANNGADVAAGGKFNLVGANGLSPMLADGQTWVICNGGADASFIADCDQNAANSLLANFNGDDYIGLARLGIVGGTIIDSIGIEGEDPGSSWPVGLDASTEDFVLWRAPDVSSGNADWDIAVDGWLGLPAETLIDTLSNADIGVHEVDWICAP